MAVDAPASAVEPGVRESVEKFYGGVVNQTPQGTLFGLWPAGSTKFDFEHTGLDHVSFAVNSREDLEGPPPWTTRASSTARSGT